MYQRSIAQSVLDALSDTPVVLITGAQQTGKTTLPQHLDGRHAQYITLDDSGFLSAASSDPAGFLSAVDGPIIIDEIQRAPELFPAIKASVDRDRRPGRFLLTGSANIFLLPKLSESLAGRMEVVTMWPLSQVEISGAGSGFIDLLFSPTLAFGNPNPPYRSHVKDTDGRVSRATGPANRVTPKGVVLVIPYYHSPARCARHREYRRIERHITAVGVTDCKNGVASQRRRDFSKFRNRKHNVASLHDPLAGDVPRTNAARMVG